MRKFWIKVENETEWDLSQRILFALGYQWGGSGFELIYYQYNRHICVWSDGDMTHGKNYELWYSGAGNIIYTFKEFLDYVEENDIRHGKF
jgi:hypothetical protein